MSVLMSYLKCSLFFIVSLVQGGSSQPSSKYYDRHYLTRERNFTNLLPTSRQARGRDDRYRDR